MKTNVDIKDHGEHNQRKPGPRLSPLNAPSGASPKRIPRFELPHDLIVLLVLSFLATLLAVQVDGLETIVEWFREYEEYKLDQLLTLLIVLSFAFAIFSWRRVRELQQQIRLREEGELKILHLAMHDTLTGLPNRALFSERLEQELARARREGLQVAVFTLDLDRFKLVNDIYGHPAGDGLLIAVAKRLQNNVRKMDTVARLGGDEFTIIQPAADQPSSAAALGTRIIQALSEPFEVMGHSFDLAVSIGIALSTPEGDSSVELLRAADVALYRSKSEGGSSFHFFEPHMDEQLRARRALERDLREALARDQLELHYQPLFTVADQSLMGFEALLRWPHPTRGWVPPMDFVSIAEETGLIQQIGDWVLAEACRTTATWPESISVSVNVSSIQFRQNTFPEKVKAILKQTGLAPGRLELEITESLLMSDTKAAIEIMSELRTFGVRIAMDDFGTGYSSLSYLRKFPFDKIKIDRSFITELEKNEDDVTILASIIAMGRSLGMVTLAEGIESSAQLEHLSKAGCQEAQGFLLGRPVNSAEVMRLLTMTDEKTTEVFDALKHPAASQMDPL